MPIAKILLIFSVISNITGYILYVYYISKNKVKPHSFTFLVWSIVLSINLLVQIFSGVGISTILLATNAIGCILIFLLCINKGYLEHDKIDILCLILAIIAIIIWLITETPLYSVILSCVIDLLAFTPSFRKSFLKPDDDSSFLYIISSLEYLVSFPAYQIFSLLVLLYPICVLTLDLSYAFFILIRRKQISHAKLTYL